MTIGGKIAEGREAEVYAWSGDAAVLKLYRAGFDGHLAESAALASLDGAGVAPRLIDAVRIDGRHGLVLQRLAGPDMLAVLRQRPWRLRGLAAMLAEAHVGINRVRAPADLPDLVQVLAARIEAVRLPAPLRDFARRTLDALPSGDRLCHGDLHPGNVVVEAEKASVIDWTNAARGVPEADYARTLLLLRHAASPPGTPGLFRPLLAAGRAAFAAAFARAYRRRSPERIRDLDAWLTVHVAARLAEGITVEEPGLIAILDRARRGNT